MWGGLYFLLGKILNVEDEDGRDDGVGSSLDHLNLIESYPYQQLLLDGRFHKAALPQSRINEVLHVNQLSSWDCGLACLVMVMKTLGIETCSVEVLASLCCSTSIWTIDLAYLLHKFSINFSYCTVTLGANPNYSDETFYKEQLPTDVLRVNKLFRDAQNAGICIQCRSISEEQISHLILSGDYVAIALVDQYKLSHNWLKDVCLSFQSDGSGYTGHYIVICGYDAGKDEFEIRDPASTRYVIDDLRQEAREDIFQMPGRCPTIIWDGRGYSFDWPGKAAERLISAALTNHREAKTICSSQKGLHCVFAYNPSPPPLFKKSLDQNPCTVSIPRPR